MNLDQRHARAIAFLTFNGNVEGAHHKAWVIDQTLRILAGDLYDECVSVAKDGPEGPDTYRWDEGIAP